MLRWLRDAYMHRANEAHVYCRLCDLGVSKATSRRLARHALLMVLVLIALGSWLAVGLLIINSK